jgi:translation initiation factor IF-2
MKLRIMRNGELMGEGQIRSLQREAQDVKEAIKGQECGVMLNDFGKYEVGDEVICYELIQK